MVLANNAKSHANTLRVRRALGLLKNMECNLEIPSSETSAWNIAEGESEGRPRIIRYRPDLEPFLGSSNYPQRLVIIWDYEIDNSSGMPSENLSEKMKDFEDALVGALDPERLAILAFVLTNSGSREWHYYVSDIQEVGNKINCTSSDLI
tara:strand:- start:56 stop:505 length:450 start_codon:yes stop_codon:yes gene_type:complete